MLIVELTRKGLFALLTDEMLEMVVVLTHKHELLGGYWLLAGETGHLLDWLGWVGHFLDR